MTDAREVKYKLLAIQYVYYSADENFCICYQQCFTIFLCSAIKYDALALSAYKRINNLLKERNYKRLKSVLNLCNNNVIYVEPFP